MSNLKEIEQRHKPDRWKDPLFIGAALLLTALALGSVTRLASGHTTQHAWSLTVVENPELAK